MTKGFVSLVGAGPGHPDLLTVQALDRLRAADLVLYDALVTPEVVALADLVVVPTRPSPHDLRSVGQTVDLVEQYGKPLVFVINGAHPTARITNQAVFALSQHGTLAPSIIHQRTDFASSMIDGRTVMELATRSRSAGEIETLWEYLRSRLDRGVQRPAPLPWGTAAVETAPVGYGP